MSLYCKIPGEKETVICDDILIMTMPIKMTLLRMITMLRIVMGAMIKKMISMMIMKRRMVIITMKNHLSVVHLAQVLIPHLRLAFC